MEEEGDDDGEENKDSLFGSLKNALFQETEAGDKAHAVPEDEAPEGASCCEYSSTMDVLICIKISRYGNAKLYLSNINGYQNHPQYSTHFPRF